MLKNIMYSILAFLILTFIYNTYIKEDEVVKVTVNNEMKLIEVTYKKDGYRVEADEQKENDEDKKIYFDMARAFFQKTLMKGNEGTFDRVTSNLFLQGDVYGINKENGWEVEGDELEYSQNLDLFYSRKRMNAFNKDRDLHIAGDYFESDTDMTSMKLERNVEAYNDVYNIKGDRARYSDFDGILNMNGHIKVKIKRKDENGKVLPDIDGDFITLVYDSKNRLLVSQGAYEVRHMGYIINADEMHYDENAGIMRAWGNATIKREDAILHVKEIILNQNTNILTLHGPLKGERGEQRFSGSEAYINTETEDIDIRGKVIVYDSESRMEADKAYYDKARSTLKLYGEKEEVEYKNPDGRLYFTYGEYQNVKEDVYIPGNFVYYGKEKSGEFKLEGRNLKYNNISQKGTADAPVIYRGDDIAKSQKARFNLGKSYYYLDGRVWASYGDYILTTKNMEIDRLNSIIYLREAYNIDSKVNLDKVYGENAIINDNKKTMESKERTHMLHNGILTSGDEMVYNYEKEEGIIGKNVYVYDKENDMELLGDRGEFKRDKYFNVYDNIKMNYGDYIATTDVIYYKIDESRVDFPNKTLMDSSIKDVKGRVEKGWYDTEESIFYGDDYVGSSGLSRSKSDYINYYLNEEKADLVGNVEVEDRETGMLVETEKLIYYRATDYAIAPEKVKITRDNVFIDGSSGNADLAKKTVELKDGVLTTSLGDKIVGDRLFGNYLKNQFDFEGNINGKVYTMNEEQLRSEEAIDYNNPLKFTGELANMYFVEALPGEYIATRSEIRNDSTFIYKNMELKGDYIEAQGSTQKVFARGNSIISLENSNQIRADSITLNLTTENAEMNSNVIISGVSEDAGGINVKADKANFDNNTSKVDLEGNIESYKGETKFNADSGVYDLVEASLAGKGNIFVILDFETYEETEAKRKKDKKDKAKLDAAKASVEIPRSIEASLYKIKMPTKHEEVSIEWATSHENYIDTEGNVYHPSRDEADVIVRLTAKYILEKKIEEKNYYIRVVKEDKYSYLKRLVNNKEFIYNIDGNLLEYKPEDEYQLKFVQRDESFVDSEGRLLSDKIEEIKDKKFAVVYYFEDISLELFYKFVEKNGEITVEQAKEEEEAVEEHNSTGLGEDI